MPKMKALARTKSRRCLSAPEAAAGGVAAAGSGPSTSAAGCPARATLAAFCFRLGQGASPHYPAAYKCGPCFCDYMLT
jgi:hypothetical protein